LSLANNALLTVNREETVRRGLINFKRVVSYANKCIAEFDVRCSGPGAAAGSLSGGNLQKFIIGREILQTPSVLIVSQPTWGVDVGAAMVIRQALLDLRSRGAAILVISEELDELFEISDRIAVIAEGRLTEGTPTQFTNRDEIGLAMTGKQARAEATHEEAGHAIAL
jgi:simple sugar transport system ATP-binding protein